MMPPTWKANEQGKTGSVQRGVIAVIITILVLELKVPHGADLAALAPLIPGFMSYVLSFVFIGIYWNNHHHLLRATTRISGAVMWANLFLLFWLSLIPVVTLWLRDYYKDPVPAAAYGVIALCSGFAYNLLVRAIIRANGRDSLVANAIASDLKGYTSLALYAAAVGLAAVSPRISYAIYAGVAVMWIVPDRRFTRK
jgi:uncharacterized membrane protein